MRLQLKGFRCYENRTFDIPVEGVILLQGESGKGKTTILTALTWLLYGGNRGIYSNTKGIKECSVELTMQGMVIYRQKKPDYLKVVVDDAYYEDDVAQEFLNTHFTSKKLWDACCYVKQKERCELLSVSQNDRLDILNKVSFSDEDPQEFIIKISDTLKNLQQQLIKDQTFYQAHLNVFCTQLKKRPVVSSEKDSVEDIQSAENRVKDLRIKLGQCEKDLYDYHQKIGIANQLSINIKNLEKQRITLPSLMPLYSQSTKLKEEFEKCRQFQDKHSQYLSLVEQLNVLNEQLEKCTTAINEQYLTYPTSDRQEIWQIEQNEYTRKKCEEECQILDIECTSESIDKERKECEEKIKDIKAYENKFHDYQQYCHLENQLKSFVYNQNDLIELPKLREMYNSNSKIIEEYKRSLDILICPHCQQPVRYCTRPFKLIKAESQPVTPEQIIEFEKGQQQLHEEIKYLEKIESCIRQHTDLLSKLQPLEPLILAYNDKMTLRHLESRYRKLMNINYVEPVKIPSIQLKYLYERQKYLQEKDRLEQQLAKYENFQMKNEEYRYEDLKNEIEKCEKEIRDIEKQQIHQETIISLINKYQSEYDNLKINHQILTDYQNLKQEVENSEKDFDNRKYGFEMRKKRNELETYKQKITEHNINVQSLEKLKATAIQVECQQLEDTVANINYIMEDILNKFFSEPITVTLSLYKELKSKKGQSKNSVNIKILYKGCEYDSVNQMSGGEGDRISLALIIALNQVNPCCFLLLDESMSAFDPHLKEIAISILKSLPNKLIISIDHGAIEGFYEHVINVL